jgi:acetyl-CoA carboxylase biotin carboxyl carrier protein
MAGLDQDTIRHALSTARRHGYRNVKLSCDDMKLEATLDLESEAAYEDVLAPSSDEPHEDGTSLAINADVVGFFEPDEVFKTGNAVEKGQTLGRIVALGIPNEIVAEENGELLETLVESGAPVEYGQPLAKLRKGSA